MDDAEPSATGNRQPIAPPSLCSLRWFRICLHSASMNYLEQAGMILYALKRVLQEHQSEHDRSSPTEDEWLTINRAIAATGFSVDEPWSRAGMGEWHATLEDALTTSSP